MTVKDCMNIIRQREDQIRDLTAKMTAARQNYSILRQLHDKAMNDLDTAIQTVRVLRGEGH